MVGSRVKTLTGFLLKGISGHWRLQGGGEWREDSEAVNESFWDAPGVEIEAKLDS